MPVFCCSAGRHEQLDIGAQAEQISGRLRPLTSQYEGKEMCHTLAKILAALLLSVVAAAEAAPAETGAGDQIAQRWCVNCHVISTAQTGTVAQGPPSFPTIAKSGMSNDQLRAFLSHPHGAMPDLALTRNEIDDLIAYIRSLR